jgi:hypothetical protein
MLTQRLYENGRTLCPIVSKLTNQGGLRSPRVAGWRIIFLVDDMTKLLSVVTIERRGQVYKHVKSAALPASARFVVMARSSTNSRPAASPGSTQTLRTFMYDTNTLTYAGVSYSSFNTCGAACLAAVRIQQFSTMKRIPRWQSPVVALEMLGW